MKISITDAISIVAIVILVVAVVVMLIVLQTGGATSLPRRDRAWTLNLSIFSLVAYLGYRFAFHWPAYVFHIALAALFSFMAFAFYRNSKRIP
jgi:steroid 5-alpha reductase family enzyme